jgi:AcrR family transcriptional regulator
MNMSEKRINLVNHEKGQGTDGELSHTLGTKRHTHKDRQLKKEQRIEGILDIAMDYFLSVGIEQTNMSDIAKDASISRKTLYQYFKSKEKIALQIELRIFQIYHEFQLKIMEELSGSGYNQLVQYFEKSVGFMADHRDMIRFTGIFEYYFSGDKSDARSMGSSDTSSVDSSDGSSDDGSNVTQSKSDHGSNHNKKGEKSGNQENYNDVEFYEVFSSIVNKTSGGLLSILQLGLADNSIVSDIEPHYLERTISDSLLSLAQRVISRGHHLDSEHHIHSEEMIQYQIKLFLKALKA